MLALITAHVSAERAWAQGIAAFSASWPRLQPRMAVPFDTGEKLTFDVRFGAIKVGTGRMEVVGMQDVRGREAWHTRFTVKGGIPFYKVNDRMESWIDTRTFESLQFLQDLQEGRRDKERFYEIYPDLATYSEKGEVEHAPSVADPLDDAAFLYFVRTIRSRWERRTSSIATSGPIAIRFRSACCERKPSRCLPARIRRS